MACALHPAAEPAAEGGPGLGFPRATAPAMTRCECAEVSFQEVARQVASGRPLDETMRRTGCGQNCTACLPDLLKHLASSL